MLSKKSLTPIGTWLNDINALLFVWHRAEMIASKRNTQTYETFMGLSLPYRVNWTGQYLSVLIQQMLSMLDGDSSTYQKTKGIKRHMPADSTLSVANSKRLCSANPTLYNIFSGTPQDQMICLETLQFLEAFDITVNYDQADAIHTMHQVDFFRMQDLIGQLVMFHDTEYLTDDEIKPHRGRLASMGRSTSELDTLLRAINITDQNCYINNETNNICFKPDAIKALIKLVNTIYHNYMERNNHALYYWIGCGDC